MNDQPTRTFPDDHPPTLSVGDLMTHNPEAPTRTASGLPASYIRPGPVKPPPGYDIEREIGHGGMGVVYKGIQQSLHRPVAIKMILEGARGSSKHTVRFLAEADSIASIHHAHVVQVYEFGQHEGCHFLALEYLGHGSLADRLAKSSPMPPREAAGLIRKVAEGVHAAHELGIVHRDLKPGNILFDDHDEPKVTDFGLAKRGTHSDVTATNAIMGTPAYMSPEQARGQNRFVSPASDVYSLGVILYECLLGKRPFDADDPMVILKLVNETDIRPLRKERRDLPRDLDLIVRKCLEKSPQRRYATAQDLAADLSRYLAGEPVKARPLPLYEQTWRWMRRHPLSAVAASMAAAILGVVIIGGKIHRDRLQTALDEAEKARADADRRRIEVEDSRLRLANIVKQRGETFEQLIDGFEVRLENLDEGEVVHAEFLTDMAGHAERLLKESPDDPQSIKLAAQIFVKAGSTFASRDAAEADRLFDRANTLYTRLAAMPECTVGDRQAQAECMFKWGRAQRLAGNRSSAISHYQAAFNAYATLERTAGPTDKDRLMGRAAFCLYYWAETLAREKSPAIAIPIYQQALQRQTELKSRQPQNVDLLEDLGLTLDGMALAIQASNPQRAVETHQRAIAEHKNAYEIQSKLMSDGASNRPQVKVLNRLRGNIKQSYGDLAIFLETQNRADELAALAGEYIQSMPATLPGNIEYNAACFLSIACKLTKQRKPAAALQFATDACMHLKKAVAAGFTDRVHLLLDPDLEAIRSDAAYSEIIKELDLYHGKAEIPTAVEIIPVLQSLFDSWQENQNSLESPATIYTNYRRAERTGISFDKLAAYAMNLKHKGAPAETSLQLMAWIVEASQKLKGGSLDVKTMEIKREAILALMPYVRDLKLLDVCDVLSKTGDPAVDAVLEKAASESGQRTADSRGFAAFYLAMSKAKQAELAPFGSVQQTGLLDAAENAFADVSKRFPTATYTGSNGQQSLAAIAEHYRYQVARLFPGRIAPGFEGKPVKGEGNIKLENYRGKVVLVSFWTQWCGVCRGLFPLHEKLMKDYTGRPFAILGVNGDAQIDVARRAIDSASLSWPSIYDGRDGSIQNKYQIRGYPHFYLIDGDGRIRYRSYGRPEAGELEKAIAVLLGEPGKK